MNNPNDFYLSLDEKQKWAIRSFLRLEDQGKRADDLSRFEDERLKDTKLQEYEQSYVPR